MTKNVVVLGSQWGDEGKGKLVDLLTDHAQGVIRFQGGHNAGHTIVIDGKKVALRLMPSGILRDHAQCFIGNGVVVSLPTLTEEIANLEKANHEVKSRLFISNASPLHMPYHTELDRAREALKGDKKIGTTVKGIGPAYEDKVARRGLRMGDLLYPKRFAEKLQETLQYHNFMLKHYYKVAEFDFSQLYDQTLQLAEAISPMIVDVTEKLVELQQAGGNLLFEGAQGTFLDIDQGTYPYVTSSNTVAGAAATGTGLGPLNINYVLGIVKAYLSRVGAGPMPTELHDSTGDYLRDRGKEFGTVTGRPRRCGWLDVVAMRRAVIMNSLTGLGITKLDVLDELPVIKMAVAYDSPKGRLTIPPLDVDEFAACKPIYEELPGWQTSTLGITRFDALPTNAQRYLRRIEEIAGVPMAIISTGPDRNETIMVDHPFE